MSKINYIDLYEGSEDFDDHLDEKSLGLFVFEDETSILESINMAAQG